MEKQQMKIAVLVLALIYIISPIDIVSGVPVDDIIVALGCLVSVLTQIKNKKA